MSEFWRPLILMGTQERWEKTWTAHWIDFVPQAKKHVFPLDRVQRI